MISYSVNWMGPISKTWIDANGSNWAGGRIDINDGTPFGDEYGLPVMKAEDFVALREFLHSYRSPRKRTFKRLVKDFEKHYGKRIIWFNRYEI